MNSPHFSWWLSAAWESSFAGKHRNWPVPLSVVVAAALAAAVGEEVAVADEGVTVPDEVSAMDEGAPVLLRIFYRLVQ